MESEASGSRIIAIPETLREVLRAEGAQALAELLNETSVQTRVDVIEITRWMFIFWIGQIGALLGILFAFFRT